MIEFTPLKFDSTLSFSIGLAVCALVVPSITADDAGDALDGGYRRHSPLVNSSVYKCIIITNLSDFK